MEFPDKERREWYDAVRTARTEKQQKRAYALWKRYDEACDAYYREHPLQPAPKVVEPISSIKRRWWNAYKKCDRDELELFDYLYKRLAERAYVMDDDLHGWERDGNVRAVFAGDHDDYWMTKNRLIKEMQNYDARTV